MYLLFVVGGVQWGVGGCFTSDLRRDDTACMQVCIVYIDTVSSTWSSMKWMDERGIYYATVRYGTVLPLGGEGMLVCMRTCTCAGLGGAVLGGAVLGGAVLCGAELGGAGFVVGV